MPVKRKPVDRQFDSLARAVIAEVVSAFDVGDLMAARSLVVEGDRVVILNEKSETSRKYVMDTSVGRYFLKEIPWYCDDGPHRDFSRLLMNRLADAGLPVPRLLRARSGQWHARHGDSSFVVMEYRSGSPFDGSPQRAASAARALAALHSATEQWAYPAWAPRESLHGIVAQHFALAAQVRPVPAQQSQLYEELQAIAARELAYSSTKSGRRLAVHGDFIPWNLAFESGSAVAAIHDFDNACVDSPLHDVGEALASFFLVPHAGMTAILQPIAEPCVPVKPMRDFLSVYRAARPISHEDLAALRGYTLGAWWESVLLSYVRGDQPPSCFSIMAGYPEALDAAWRRIVDDEAGH